MMKTRKAAGPVLACFSSLLIFLAGCGGGAGGGPTPQSSPRAAVSPDTATATGSTDTPGSTGPGVATDLVAGIRTTTLSTMVEEVARRHPTVISPEIVARLSGYQLAQNDVLPSGAGTAIWEGTWDKIINASGMCYVSQYQKLDRICSQAGAPTSAIGRHTFKGTTAVGGSGLYSGVDLQNGLTAQGSYKIFYGFKSPTSVAGAVTAVPFAISVLGDIWMKDKYYYSTLLSFEGIALLDTDVNGPRLRCISVNGSSRPGVAGRYTQYVLTGSALAPGKAADYDVMLVQSEAGSVAAAPPNC